MHREKTNVLLVDDKLANLVALEAILSDPSYNLVCAPSAAAALKRLGERDFAVLLLDVMMPDVDGFQLAQMIRAYPRTKDTPIIFLTAATADATFTSKAYAAGAVDFLTKPLVAEVVQAKVRVFVELHCKSRRILRQSEELRRIDSLKLAAESANQMKSNFLASMSHEIRTPLTAILGFAELLASQETSEEERREYVETIQRNGQCLARLIDDILDLSKVEAGRLELERLPVVSSELARDLIATFESAATKKGLTLSVTQDGLGPELYTDPARLRQILFNLIGNAIKFTHRGDVSIHFEKIEGQAGPGLSITVSDTGIGLSEEHSRRLFQHFAQADTSIARRFGGTGLGLALSRRLARALGGDLTLEKTSLGEGSTFQLKVPNQDSDAKAPDSKTLWAHRPDQRAAPASLPLVGARVLIVDDAADNRRLFSRFLEVAGARVDVACDGRAAVEMALAINPDIILMDVEMPEVSGHEATLALRRLHYSGAIVAVTAHAMKGDKEQCLEVGYNDHLSKPVNRDLLVSTIANYLERQTQGHPFLTSTSRSSIER